MPPSIEQRASMKVSRRSDQVRYANQAMQDARGSAGGIAGKSPTRPTSSAMRKKSSGRSRVSFSETGTSDEKKVDDGHRPAPVLKRVPRRKSSDRLKKNSTAAATALRAGKENSTPARQDKGKEEAPVKKGFMSRLSSRFGDKKKGFVKVPETNEEEEEAGSEDDPVMTIFESRNTQRVRFSLEGVGGDRIPERKCAEEETVPEKQAKTSIKQFMSRALFGSSKSSSNKQLDEEMKREVAEVDRSLVWESAETPTGPEVIHTTSDQQRTGEELTVSFTEDPKARATVVKLLDKARRAEHIHFRYGYAVKCYLKALSVLKKAKYPDDHPTVSKTVRLLNNAHHVLSSYSNSANIVKMGIKYEDSGELVRALKMYTIAYRIRTDNLSRNHPSLVVLLNMVGSIQIKRGELKEAMQIYELALNASPVIFNANAEDDQITRPTGNLLAKSVTYREMGTIYERWGNVDEALKIYHKSLECVTEWKESIRGEDASAVSEPQPDARTSTVDYSLDKVQLTRSSTGPSEVDGEKGEMELVFASSEKRPVGIPNRKSSYESFFPSHLEDELDRSGTISNNSNGSGKSSRDAYADMDLALTLHQIAQLHRCQGHFSKALDAYEVALRGMKYALGKHHPNVAAVLGNIGNLQKEMGDLDAAYLTYQEVLGIESYRLGLSHPDVAITLHNIATIDAARGNYDHALQLYRKVIGLQKKLFGPDHVSVAVTAACMGDVYERVGEYSNSMDSFEEAVRIKAAALGRHSLDVARLLHKLGKLAFLREDYHMADSFLSRANLIYRLNKVNDDHEWMVDANRDVADIDAAIAVGKGRHFEC